MQNLVIVESPTKAKTLAKYLGDKYQIEASMGHVRDLPKSDIGVDAQNNFEPKYIIPKDKQKRVNELKRLAASADSLWLATDPDREGEAIAWHLSELLEVSRGERVPQVPRGEKTSDTRDTRQPSGTSIHRVVFHEITPEAIKEAFEDPRDIDLRLVDAQQARRILDRLVGYKLSPLLWKKVKSGLSAGRVQSVALRLIVEREGEITAFKPEEYWSVTAELNSKLKTQNSKVEKQETSFSANLIEQNGKKLAVKNKEEADKHVKALEKADYRVEKVTRKEVKKYPAPPFITSTLQQAAANRLGLSAKKTMMLAQHLYEHGLITYMRTDSFNLSSQAVTAARNYIEQNIGKAYLPATPKLYKTKSKVAQEAHEAIRPTNIGSTSDQLKTMEGLSRDHVRLYELIWKRMMACQMNEAVLDHTTIDVAASGHPDNYLLRATGSVIKFDGWLKVYGKVIEEEGEDGQKEQALPKVSEGEGLKLLQLLPEQHFTEGPPRYNEASLIKKLEELGIGRPSTYAAILSTILERFYVEKKERKFFPTPLGAAVTEFLMANFPDIFDYEFTAGMEDNLDDIARGERKWQPTIKEFYLPFEKKLEIVEESAERVKIATEETDKTCPDCGKPLIIRFGKFGKFLACSGFPDCKYTAGLEEKVDAKCPDCEGDIIMRKTRKGRPFYGCKNWPTCKFASWTKPKEVNRGQVTGDSGK